MAGKLDSPGDEDCVELAKHLLSGCQASLLHFLSTRIFIIVNEALRITKTKFTCYTFTEPLKHARIKLKFLSLGNFLFFLNPEHFSIL